ncbi:hypothetical protein ACFV5N_09435 [Streptomyces sp. NPDC059853]|uniref:recombination directionality factor n=1 Tax=Streptomyces sp. NPDC059853 TaxID=3346973 RepID=UPI00365B2FF8
MPILDLQQRIRQLGEIRIGHVVDTGRISKKTGKPIRRPAKLDRFRLTSPSKEILTEVAKLYGGEVQPWTPANGGPAEFEVYTKAARLPVLVPPRGAMSQWYEQWQGSKCVRRCDGRTEVKSERACPCDPVDRECKPTTRISVMLRDVPALGQWLLISHGYYAALELPGAAEVLAMAGGYVDGWLGMEERVVMRDEGPARFMVPTLDVAATPRALMSGQGTAVQAVTTPGRVAIASGRPDYAELARVATTADEVGALWRQASAAGHLDDDLAAALKMRGEQLRAAEVEEPEPDVEYDDAEPEPDEDGAIVAEIVDDDEEPSEVWFAIVAAAGRLQLPMPEVQARCVEQIGVSPSEATAAQLRAFLRDIKAGGVR